MEEHPLDAGAFDRTADARADRNRLQAFEADATARYLPVWRNKSPVSRDDAPRPVLLSAEGVAALSPRSHPAIFLGRVAGRPIFAVALPNEEELARHPQLADHADFRDLRVVGSLMRSGDASLLSYARGMVVWHRDHRFCGRCGGPTAPEEGGHVLACTDCDTKHFPRTDPAMMALIEWNDRILLARKSTFPPGMHSVLAGFVEPGESVEEAVRREVYEEVGLEVTDVRYVRSQPWPFPRSLMVGYAMKSRHGDLRLDHEELEAGGWFTRDEVARAEKIYIPPRYSLAGQLVGLWLAGEI
ncbi:MAG: NAD(+) diphosphatase [Myxococcota bacterium]